jgi:23S rRNA (uracil1939-C5)-methyltransferase
MTNSENEPTAPQTKASVDGICVTIDRLSSEGDGVARLEDGRVVFVEGGLPGDRVELESVEERKRFVRARIARLETPSPDRVEPECAAFGVCGGCTWQHLAYEAQLEAKRVIVRDALARIGRIELDELPPIVASPSAYGYRARAKFVEAPTGYGYRERSSRNVKVVDHCPVLVPAADAVLKERVEECRAESGTKDSGNSNDSNENGESKHPKTREWSVTAGSTGPALVSRVRSRGKPRSVSIDLSGERLRVSSESFLQGNALLWDALIESVTEACLLTESRVAGSEGDEPKKAPLVTELYCGIGFFTIPLARSGAKGWALESDRSAVADLTYNLRRCGVTDRFEVLSGRVETRGDLVQRLAAADVVLMDPPRIGLEESVREALRKAKPKRIVYLSCDPATLARDLSEILQDGYSIASIELFDLFPQTPHVETLVRLERSA